ncbi:MAG TPA: hypothetical protein VMI32_10295 [Candidatus Solibacter sp.]|nr:hypothetical protein [Candidatus Solibacter sp.]
MNHVRKMFSTLGGILLAALLIAALAPKAARGVAAALVQIAPGTATHIGQNESRLVSLYCNVGNSFCNSVDSSGNVASAAYQVPAGFTLIITDYEYKTSLSSAANQFLCDNFQNASNLSYFLNVPSCALADGLGDVYGKEHFTTGIRVGSGVTLLDFAAASREGFASMQGYLVPNN